MRKELSKVYDPHEVEGRIYQQWEENKCFAGVRDAKKKPYTIVMPPPNVTGQLHMGHAMDCTLQDILIRFKRMQGYAALWVPGTDHAGIATQIKVEEELRVKEGLTRYDLGREKFLERVWDWKAMYGDRIVAQQKKMGASCDWDRARFTMDEGCSKAVRETFCELYEKGLIYKGSRIINWCPHCVTALSDAEVEYVDKPGHLWHMRYPLSDGSGYLVVATTRPETMMGDTGVAVNPNDTRYQHLVGKTCLLPLMNREIPIVADEYVEMDFGTGCVKMTPAHDPNDFEVGLRHNLDTIRVLDDNGVVNANGGKYEGMDRYAARKAVVADMEALGLMEKVEDYSHNVGTCYRCHNDVEPIISAQWFVKMAPLAKEAIRVVEQGETKFVPDRFSKTYLNWMENVHDWCISRQLWWGHQIPVWYCADCGKMTVSREDPTQCQHCEDAPCAAVCPTHATYVTDSGVVLVDPEKCIGCRTCELVCSFGHYQKFSPRLSNITVLEYEAATLAVPVVCQQCEDASCMKVCPVHAISRNEDGIVTINYDACIGCRLCTNACALGNMSYSPRLRKVFKCDQCGGDPKCVRYCPGGALTYEDAGRMDPRKKLTADKIVAAMGMEV